MHGGICWWVRCVVSRRVIGGHCFIHICLLYIDKVVG